MTILEIIEQIWGNTWRCWASADNIRRITSGQLRDAVVELENAQAGPEQDAAATKKLLWNELLVRARWATLFLAQQMKPKIAETYEMAGGNAATLAPWTQLRARVPISFSEQPPPDVIALEASFTPDDEILRTVTEPFTEQHNHLYTALITSSYKAAGMGITLDAQFKALSPDEDLRKQWDDFIRQGLEYLSYGRGCFFESEVALNRLTESYRGNQARRVDLNIGEKYLQENSTIKAIGGLFTLNVELLPAEWAAKVEPDPVEFRGI